MDEINLKQIVTDFPDCITNGAKLKAILLDTYPEMPRGMINAILIISNSGIVREIQNSANIDKIATDRWLKKLGLPHKGFRSLRHTFATRALECGMDVKSLSEILGRKNATITLNRYAHSLWEQVRNDE